jgi:hypothetical protein
MHKTAEADDQSGLCVLQGEHSTATLGVVGLGDLKPLMAGRLSEGLAIADPAHDLWIRIYLVERIEVF